MWIVKGRLKSGYANPGSLVSRSQAVQGSVSVAWSTLPGFGRTAGDILFFLGAA